MSDEERDEDDSAPAAALPKKKKKKRRAALAAPVDAAPPPPEATSAWTSNHLAGALAAGIALGALGGYMMWGRGAASPEAGVAKEGAAPSAQAPGRGAQSTAVARPQQPPEPAAPVYIALAATSPREGPEHAKVTILEFSDFQ